MKEGETLTTGKNAPNDEQLNKNHSSPYVEALKYSSLISGALTVAMMLLAFEGNLTAIFFSINHTGILPWLVVSMIMYLIIMFIIAIFIAEVFLVNIIARYDEINPQFPEWVKAVKNKIKGTSSSLKIVFTAVAAFLAYSVISFDLIIKFLTVFFLFLSFWSIVLCFSFANYWLIVRQNRKSFKGEISHERGFMISERLKDWFIKMFTSSALGIMIGSLIIHTGIWGSIPWIEVEYISSPYRQFDNHEVYILQETTEYIKGLEKEGFIPFHLDKDNIVFRSTDMPYQVKMTMRSYASGSLGTVASIF